MTKSDVLAEKHQFLKNYGEDLILKKHEALNRDKPQHRKFKRRKFATEEMFHEHLWRVARYVYKIYYSETKADENTYCFTDDIVDYCSSDYIKIVRADAKKQKNTDIVWVKPYLRLIQKEEQVFKKKELNCHEFRDVLEIKSNSLTHLGIRLYLKKDEKDQYCFFIKAKTSVRVLLPYFILKTVIQYIVSIHSEVYTVASLVQLLVQRYLISASYMIVSLSGLKEKENIYSYFMTDTILNNRITYLQFCKAWSNSGEMMQILHFDEILAQIIGILYLYQGDKKYWNLNRMQINGGDFGWHIDKKSTLVKGERVGSIHRFASK